MRKISTRRREMHRKGTTMENNHRTQTEGDLITPQKETMHLSNSITKVEAGNDAHYAKNVEERTAETASLGSRSVLDVGNQGTS